MISVVMSTYKEPIEYIEQSINSILNQTYRDIEFIIIRIMRNILSIFRIGCQGIAV